MPKAKTSHKDTGYFPETLEKDVLRERDARLIARLAAEKRRSLTYCGMCGVEARDVLKWKNCLGRIEVIERKLPDDGERLLFKTGILSKLTPHFNGNVRVHFADAWDFLNSPSFGSDFPIDVVNLDFCGGLCYEVDMEYPKQRTAFSNLFSAAARLRSDFLLLMTLMPRDRGSDSYKRYLDSVFSSLRNAVATSARSEFEAQIAASKKFHESGNLPLFKACLPILLEDIARGYNFSIRPAYVRFYTTMIHFAFECSFVPGVLGLPPIDPNTLIRNLNQPIRKLLPNGTEECQRAPQLTLV